MAKRSRFGSIQRLPSGRYRARFTLPGTEQWINAPVTFDARIDAETWLATQRADLARGTWKPATQQPAVLTFGEYSRRWLDHRELRPRTREHYETIREKFLLPRFGDMPIGEIAPSIVIEWHAKLRTGKTYKAHAYALLRSIMRSAVVEEIIDRSPCTIPKAGRSPKAKITPRVRSNEELARLTAAMPDEYALMVPLAAWCTTRYGEAAALTRADVDMRHHVLHIRRAVTFVKGDAIVGPPKSAEGVRDVDIPDAIMPAIKLHLRRHVALGDDALLFPGPSGGHLRTGTFYSQAWWPARRAAGLDRLHYHDLRHHGLTSAAIVGATLRELMARGGHSTVSAALIYQSVAQDRGKEIAAKLSALASGDTHA
jgi:integrase